MAQTYRHTDKHTDGHGNSMTDPAQRAKSVKRCKRKVQGALKDFRWLKVVYVVITMIPMLM